MSTLSIIKLESGAFIHSDSIDGEFFLGRFSFKNEFSKAFLAEAYGAKKREYVIEDIFVYNYLGSQESFTSFTELINRLVQLKYTGIDTTEIDNYLSNVVTEYTDATIPLAGAENVILNDGLGWKKISWTNIKLQLQLFFENIFQPLLTDVNFGAFMDVGVAPKPTPIATDTILGRDITTNKAVEIPFSAFSNGTYGLNRQQFVFSGSQTFTLSANYAQVYSVSVQGGGTLKDTQYTLVAPNQITILDTLETGDYIVVIYSSSAVGVQPYYSQAVTDSLLALKQNKFYSNKLTTPSISLTGTLAETELVKITIPANTFSASDIIRIPTISMTKVGVNNAATIRLKISTSATMPAGGTGQIAQFTVNATTLFQNVNRVFYLDSGNLKGWPFTTAANTDISASTNAMSTVAFDRTVTQYLYISGTLLSTADILRIEGLQIMNS